MSLEISIDTTTPPECFKDYLGETNPEKQLFWICLGTDIPRKKSKLIFWNRASIESTLYLYTYHSKEEAEAHASQPHKYWLWGRKPAIAVSLQTLISKAREEGLAGVSVKGFKDGKWIELKRYNSNEPLTNQNGNLA